MLNDPKKRTNYDKFGVTGHELDEFSEFEDFMGDFGLFEEFLDDILSVKMK